MALDSNLYTLSLQRRADDPAVLDLVPIRPDAAHLAALSNSRADNGSHSPGESSKASLSMTRQDPLYTYSRARTTAYNVQLIDAPTQLPLASVTCPTSSERAKTMQLLNPDEDVHFEKKGNTFRQEWKFSFSDNDFIIRRDGKAYTVFANRKPDPEIDIVRYTPPYARHKPGILQVLDYNIQRLEVSDRRGLEIISILAVCHCLDQEYDETHKDLDNIYLAGAMPLSVVVTPSEQGHGPEAKTADAMQGTEPNEIIVPLHTPIATIVDYAISLLRLDAEGQGMHMIVLRAQNPDTTPLAVRVAAEIKARWYKLPPVAKGRTMDPAPGAGSDVAEELYQYVRDPSASSQQKQSQGNGRTSQDAANSSATGRPESAAGPRGRIKLDAPKEEAKPSSRPSSSNGPASKLHALIGGSSPGQRSPTASLSPEPTGMKSRLAPAPAPSQLVVYLCKDRIDEFERETRTLGDSFSAARMAKMDSASQFATATSSPSPPPRLPPKTSGRPRPPANHSANNTPTLHSPQQHHSASHPTAPHRLLNKLGIRTNRSSET